MKLAQIDFDKIQLPSSGNGAIDLNKGDLTIGEVVGALVKYLFPLAGLLLLLYLLYGGFQLMTSSGDPKKMQDAKAKLSNALIGFIIVFASYWIVQIVGRILGIEAIITLFG